MPRPRQPRAVWKQRQSGASVNQKPPGKRRLDSRTGTALVAGAAGGILVVGIVVGTFAITGRVMSSATTVTIVEGPISPVLKPTHGYLLTAGQIYQRDEPGVVFINASGTSGVQSAEEYMKGEGGGPTTATGSGFEIDRSGTIATNWHVVEGAAKITVGLEHGVLVKARLVGKDASDDLALLRVPIAGVTPHPLILGDSGMVKVGDTVYAIGNPFGLGGTLTTGIISALSRRITSPNGATIGGALQTDAPVNPGNSGGPLVNDGGEVIGINSQIETSGNRGGSVGIAFAIPINTVKRDLSGLGAR